jgi:hypothetical protein
MTSGVGNERIVQIDIDFLHKHIQGHCSCLQTFAVICRKIRKVTSRAIGIGVLFFFRVEEVPGSNPGLRQILLGYFWKQLS